MGTIMMYIGQDAAEVEFDGGSYDSSSQTVFGSMFLIRNPLGTFKLKVAISKKIEVSQVSYSSDKTVQGCIF